MSIEAIARRAPERVTPDRYTLFMTSGGPSRMTWVPAHVRRLWGVAPAQLVFGVVFLLISAALLLAGLVITGERALTNLENFFYQIFFGGFGIVGGWLISSVMTRSQERDRMERQSSSAVRRSFQLLTGMQEIDTTARQSIEELKASGVGQVPAATVEVILARVAALAEARTTTAEDAVSDWRDAAPKAVDAEVKRLTEQQERTRRRRRRGR